MFESLVNPMKGERKPWELFFVGLLYTMLSIFLANWLFSGNAVLKDHISLAIVFFVVNFSIPFMYYTIRWEEEKTFSFVGEGSILKEHSRALLAFFSLFLGFVVAFSVFFVLFPSQAEESFTIQVETYCQINSGNEEEFKICTEASLPTGKISSEAEFIRKEFSTIFFNNLNVMLIAVLFSFFFGAGGIFILAWNASVIGAAIGIAAKSVDAIPFGFLRFMVHGTPEILAYFVAGLAGGIIGVAVIRHHFAEEKFMKIIKDAGILFAIAVSLLLVAALMEILLTPAIFA